jgi:hypothetical protein
MPSQLKQREPMTRREAEKRTAKHKADRAGLRKGWVRFIQDVEKSVQLGVPAALGMNMREWLDKTFDQSASTIFRQLASYRRMRGVPQSTLEAISEASAHELRRLRPKDQKDSGVLQKAMEQSPSDFRKTVADIRHVKYGIPRDDWETYARRVPKSVFDLMIAAEEKVAAVLKVDISKRLHDDDFPMWLGNVVVVLEAQAQLVNDTDVTRLHLEIEGDEGRQSDGDSETRTRNDSRANAQPAD